MEKKPSLADALALIAATGIGLSCWRSAIRLGPAAPFNGSIWACYFHGFLFSVPLLSMWSIAIAALHLLTVRPLSPVLIRRPGFVLTFAALVGLLDGFVKGAGHAMYSSSDLGGSILHAVSTTMPGEVGLVVVGALVALALGGQCRPHACWLDRSAWFLGVAWIGLLLLAWSRTYLAAIL